MKSKVSTWVSLRGDYKLDLANSQTDTSSISLFALKINDFKWPKWTVLPYWVILG